MKYTNLLEKKSLALSVFLLLITVSAAFPQTTSFKYQGRLESGGTIASGSFDFEFRLFGALSGGTQIGSLVSAGNVIVTNGTFTVNLDFGNQFPGANRFLEIRVRQTGGGGFTPLLPRQEIGSSPYSVKSLSAETASTATNATQLGGVSSSQYVVTGDPRMTDSRTPTSGSNNYVQNGLGQQVSSNFYVSGTGRARFLSADSHYELGGVRILSSLNGNMFVGLGAGAANTTGLDNTFFGDQAGFANQTASHNSFFGTKSGQLNTTGEKNSFFGRYSGQSNSTGSSNSFFGFQSGILNTTGSNNSFFGLDSGRLNTTGSSNSFFGDESGRSNTSGEANSFFGYNSGQLNTIGFRNSFFGGYAGGKTTSGSSNSFFGWDSGGNNTTGGANVMVGNIVGSDNTTGSRNSFVGYSSGVRNGTGSENTFFGTSSGDRNVTGSNNTIIGANADVSSSSLAFATAIGASATVGSSNSVVLGRPLDRVSIPGTATIGSLATQYGQLNLNAPSSNANFYMSGDGATKGINFGVDSTTPAEAKLFISQYNGVTYLDRLTINENGVVAINVLGTAGATALCRNASNQISTCSSSLRYKTNINPFGFGLNLVKQLRPISFDWKGDGMHDLGFGAEDVAAIEPLLVTYNDKGEVEGVKYDRVGVVLVNAVNEQQAQIEAQQESNKTQQNQLEAQQKLIEAQQKQIEDLKQIVCQSNPAALFCKKLEGNK